jgi:hypothetical protein
MWKDENTAVHLNAKAIQGQARGGRAGKWPSNLLASRDHNRCCTRVVVGEHAIRGQLGLYG